MITRKSATYLLNALPSTSYICAPCRRYLHKHVKPDQIPRPTPFVPDATTFLTLIGRELSKHSTKFTSWEQLFTATSPQLREIGIEPARTRRYLLAWRERFRRGEFGVGGDLQYVQDGIGELRIVQLPKIKNASAEAAGVPEYVSVGATPGKTKLILNVPHSPRSEDGSAVVAADDDAAIIARLLEGGGSVGEGEDEGNVKIKSTFDLKKPKGFKLLNGHAIVGPYVQPVKGSNGSIATLKVQEGLWEHRRGHKVDGGERRKAEVRFKRRVEERKKERS